MNRFPWLLVVLCLALAALFVATACAPPPPKPVAWYDAHYDVIHYDDAQMAQVAEWYGQPGIDWINAHEEGHRTTSYVFRDRGVDLSDLMPGATVSIRLEQVAQCLARASLGHGSPWKWGPVEVAEGYWDCDQAYVALVEAAS